MVAISDSTQYDLGVEVFGKLHDELRLNRDLLVHQTEVVLKLGGVRDDDTLAVPIILRTTGTAEHLEHILRRELDPTTLLGIYMPLMMIVCAGKLIPQASVAVQTSTGR